MKRKLTNFFSLCRRNIDQASKEENEQLMMERQLLRKFLEGNIDRKEIMNLDTEIDDKRHKTLRVNVTWSYVERRTRSKCTNNNGLDTG